MCLRCLIRLQLKVFEVASVLQPLANADTIRTSTCTPTATAAYSRHVRHVSGNPVVRGAEGLAIVKTEVAEQSGLNS